MPAPSAGGKSTIKCLYIALVVLLLCSCSAGLRFNHDKAAGIDLHQMRSSEFANVFGSPYREWSVTTGDGAYREVWYFSALRGFPKANVSRRMVFLEFKDEKLNAYMYASSFNADKTRVDLSKVRQIKVGVSSKGDVLAALGRPYGKALCPSALKDFKERCKNAAEVWAWYQFDTTASITANDRRGQKTLFVMFR